MHQMYKIHRIMNELLRTITLLKDKITIKKLFFQYLKLGNTITQKMCYRL